MSYSIVVAGTAMPPHQTSRAVGMSFIPSASSSSLDRVSGWIGTSRHGYGPAARPDRRASGRNLGPRIEA